jgi:hypothetical protein
MYVYLSVCTYVHLYCTYMFHLCVCVCACVCDKPPSSSDIRLFFLLSVKMTPYWLHLGPPAQKEGLVMLLLALRPVQRAACMHAVDSHNHPHTFLHP